MHGTGGRPRQVMDWSREISLKTAHTFHKENNERHEPHRDKLDARARIYAHPKIWIKLSILLPIHHHIIYGEVGHCANTEPHSFFINIKVRSMV